jgi:predicted permease
LHEQFAGPLRVLMATVAILLVLACANLGGLLLARGAARQHEMAVRVSLGAGRFRIVRQVLTESLLLAAAGSALGLVTAQFAAGMLMRIMTSGTRSLSASPPIDVSLDARVLIFTMMVTGLAALAFGAAPAIAAFASPPATALRTGRAGAHPRSRRLVGRGLVVAQVALSLALLSVSQLYVGHLARLRDRSLGFDRTHVLIASIDTSAASRSGRSREELAVLFQEALGRLQAIPGVRAATASGMTPISGAAGSRFLRAEGFDEPPQARRRVSLNNVAPNYFATYGTPIMAGRDFRDADAGAARRVIVNQALVRHYFAGRDPIGRRVWFDSERDPYEIVGVVADAKYQDVRLPAPPIAYVHYAQPFRPVPDLSLRTTAPPAAVAGDVRRVVSGVFGDAAVRRITTLADQVDAAIVPERLLAALSAFFGVVGMLLAAIGLYGLLAYTVSRRAAEIGIRMALGASRADVVRLVLTSAAGLVAAGLLLGAPAAFWSTRLATRTLEHLPPGGVLPIVACAAALVAVAIAAACVPVRRATRVDPIRALRSE